MSKSSIPTDWHNWVTCRHWTGVAIPNAFCTWVEDSICAACRLYLHAVSGRGDPIIVLYNYDYVNLLP